eukprot:2190886-Amphidinium_carterae.1
MFSYSPQQGAGCQQDASLDDVAVALRLRLRCHCKKSCHHLMGTFAGACWKLGDCRQQLSSQGDCWLSVDMSVH